MIIRNGLYLEEKFFKLPIEVLWTSFSMSRFLVHKDELGIVKSKKYPVLEDIDIECIFCEKYLYSQVVNKNGIKKEVFTNQKDAWITENKHLDK